MIYLDTSALLKLYVREAGSVEVHEFVTRQSQPLPVWEIQWMEFLNAMRLKVFWKEITPKDADRQIGLFQRRKQRGLYFFPEINRADLTATFERLTQKTMKSGCRTMDILHVACALHLQAETFLSFDKRQRALGTSEGLDCPVLPASA